MIRLDFTREEQQILYQVLDGYLSDLRMEISDTDLLDYRQMLKVRKEVVVKTLEALRHTPETAPPGE